MELIINIKLILFLIGKFALEKNEYALINSLASLSFDNAVKIFSLFLLVYEI